MASGKSLLQLRELAQLGKASLATQANASKMVKPPLAMFGVDGRYASALYSAASKHNKLDQVDKNLKTLLELQQKDIKFREFLVNPLIKVCLQYYWWPIYLLFVIFICSPSKNVKSWENLLPRSSTSTNLPSTLLLFCLRMAAWNYFHWLLVLSTRPWLFLVAKLVSMLPRLRLWTKKARRNWMISCKLLPRVCYKYYTNDYVY